MKSIQLAIEADEELSKQNKNIALNKEFFEDKDVKITRIYIETDEQSKILGRKKGDYITIEYGDIMSIEYDCVIRKLGGELRNLCNLKETDKVLVAGLGNRYITPDAVGPKSLQKILVTSHIDDDNELLQNLRKVSAIQTGVMGQTGIETAQLIETVVNATKPDVLIAIDALASRSIDRLSKTIQLTNSGISPGAGIGNKRKELSKETLGIPVIGVGVPTVVDCATLVLDTVGNFLEAEEVDEDQLYSFVKSSLAEQNMFVTPKNIDSVVEKLGYILSSGVNMALHHKIDMSDINKLMT